MELLKLKRGADKLKNGMKMGNEEGNQCIYTMFILFNMLMFLTSLGIFGIAIFLFVLTKDGNAFNITILIVGFVLLVFSLMAFKMRRSIHLLGMYLIILGLIAVFEIIITIITLVSKQTIIELAEKAISDQTITQEIIDQLNNNVAAVSYVMIVFCVVVLCTLCFGVLYRNSTKGRTVNAKENLLNEQKYQEQVKAIEEVVQKNQEKRLLYEQKYPELAKHNKK